MDQYSSNISREPRVCSHEICNANNWNLSFVSNSMGLASVRLTYIGSESYRHKALGEMTQNNGHYAVRGHYFWYRLKKASMQLLTRE